MKKNYKNYIKIICFLFFSILSAQMKGQHFNFEGGNAVDPVWIIFFQEVTLGDIDLEAGDEIAVFDGSTMVGALTLTQVCTPVNFFENDLAAFSTVNSGPGYTSGNPVSFKCWDASQEIESASFSISFEDPYGVAWTQSVFPSGDGEYSVVHLSFDWTYVGSLAGTITNAENSQPIEGAFVTVEGTSYNATTIANGTYLIEDIETGIYSVTANAAGYYPETIAGVEVFSEETTTVAFNLLPVFPSQYYNLTQGYQLISSRLISGNPDMQNIFQNNLDNLEFVRNTAGFMLQKIGPVWVNNIGDWINTEGYLIKMSSADQLAITGPAIDPQTPITLTTGYQIIGYLPVQAVNAEDVFYNILESLEFVRNTAGFMFQKIGPVWVNNIGDMQPGEGYLVYMNSDNVLIYPAFSSFTCGDPFTDSRNGQIYQTALIGEQCWMAENLNIGTMINGNEEMADNSEIEKYCYENNTVNCDDYGGLYQWNEMMQYVSDTAVQGICPDGWYIPTDHEWKLLEGTVDSQYPVGHQVWNNTDWRGFDAGLNLKSATAWNGTDLFQFAGLSGGSRNYDGNFYNTDVFAFFWSSTEDDNSLVWDRRLHNTYGGVARYQSGEGFGFSVRCLKDETIQINMPPQAPSSPSPEHEAINQSIEVDLSWTCTDPEADPLNYDIYFGTEATPPQIATAQTEITFDPGTLEYNTEYFWKIIAHDYYNNTTEGPVWSFTTEVNLSPESPSSPSPEHESENQSIEVDLSWTCTDPEGDPLAYDIYFGTEASPPQVATSQTETTFDPGTLESHIEYYWKIVAHDDHSNTTEGPIWSFITEAACGEPFIDPRDGQTYNSILIGGQCWMAENLNIGNMINSSQNQQNNGNIEKYCYGNNPTYCNNFGGLYQWNEMMQYTTTPGVQGICPAGWHIPTDDEWKILEGTVDSQYPVGHPIWNSTGWRGYNAGLNLKTTNGWNGNNYYGFSALPGGYRDPGGSFNGFSEYAYFYSSLPSGSGAWSRALASGYSTVFRNIVNQDAGCSVRCLKDEINYPPETPSSPIPENGVENQSIEIDISWTCSDPEGDPLTYDIYFGTEATPPQVASGQTETTYDPGTLEYNTEYFWKIVTHDDHSNTTEGQIWSFTTVINLPPESPSTPSPNDGAENQSIEVDISWTCSDPEGDPLTYDIYFGTGATPPQVATGQTETTYNPGTLEKNTEYFWKIVAHDDHSNTTEGPVWSFTTLVNLPPESPSSPSPEHEAENQSIEVDLSWTCTDPEGDPLTYDIYFGTEATPPQVAIAQTEITYDPGILEYNTEYFWKIVAHDDQSNTTEGPVWSFTTVNLPPEPPSSPNPEHEAENQSIEVDLSWTCTDPEGDPLTYDIYFGTEATPPQVATSQTETTFDPGTLESHIEYYWKIVAHDDHSNTTEGPVWSFITEAACGEPFIDPRDGQTYNTTLIGSQCWMAENLNIGAQISGGQNMTDNSVIEKYCYDNNPGNCNYYGGLYQWNEMMQYSITPGEQGICPAGWHLPTDDEWKILEGTVDSQYPVGDPIWNNAGWRGYNAGLNLKSNSSWDGNNYYGFSALPGGFWDPGDGFNNLSNYNHLWTSSSSGGGAWSRSLTSNYHTVYRNIFNQGYGFSVRCIKGQAFQCGNPITDPRDQQTYETIEIGEQCWMAENLNIGTMISGSQPQQNNGTIEKYCYGNSSGNCNEYGGLYQWDEMMQYTTTQGVQGICPSGWHLPTDGEWTILTDFLGGVGVASGKMKETGTTHWASPNTGATNESGFTALPGGNRTTSGSFYHLINFAYLWSSSEIGYLDSGSGSSVMVPLV